METLQIKLLREEAKIPNFATTNSAGADLSAVLDSPVTIYPGETRFIPTGLAMAIPTGVVGVIAARSGIACKRDLAPANKVGIIDNDYRGEIIVALHNHGHIPRTVEPGERIAQMLFLPFLQFDFVAVDNLDATERGAGGFGSTGET